MPARTNTQPLLSVPHPDMAVGLVGNLGPLDTYKCYSDRRHLRLGLELPGMLKLLEAIGFIYQKFDFVDAQTRYSSVSGWEVVRSYRRSSSVNWCDGVFGGVRLSHGDSGWIVNVVGYDLADYIRSWLKREGHQSKSLCEVVLVDERFKELRPKVGVANVFWSHLQKESVVPHTGQNMSTLGSLEKWIQSASRESTHPNMKFIWLDYFSLRQAQTGDFDSSAVIELMRGMVAFVACIDPHLEYTQRSFCVLEVFAALSGGVGITCYSPGEWYDVVRHKMEDRLAKDPIRSEWAQTRDPADKCKIDEYVRERVGFRELDRAVTKGILEASSIDDVTHDRECGYGMRTCLPWWCCLWMKTNIPGWSFVLACAKFLCYDG